MNGIDGQIHHVYLGKSMKIDHDGVRYMNSLNEEVKTSPTVTVKQVQRYISKQVE